MVITAFGPDNRPKQPLDESKIKQREERGQELLSLHKALFEDGDESLGKHKNFKMDLCMYYQKGTCANGTKCSFAHGEQELRARPVNYGHAPPARSKYVEAEIAARFAREKDSEVMSWLKVQREQTGEKGAIFESQWKEWCKIHDVQSLSKSERVKRLHTFKAEWEAGNLPMPAGESPQAPWPALKGSAAKKSKAPPVPKLKCLEGHEMADIVCSEVEEFGCDSCGIDVTHGGKLFDCRECDYSLCDACGIAAMERLRQLLDVAREAPESPQSPSVPVAVNIPEPGAASFGLAPLAVANHAAAARGPPPGLEAEVAAAPAAAGGPFCPQNHPLKPLVCQKNVEYSCDGGCDKELTCGDILYYCDPCDFCLCEVCGDEESNKSEQPTEEEEQEEEEEENGDESFPEVAWQDGIRRLQEKLMKLGGRLRLEASSTPSRLFSECRKRLSASGASLFAGPDSCKSMTRTCLSEQNLSAVATALRLGAIFPTEMGKADLTRTVIEALLQNQKSLPEGEATCASLLDFVCCVGFAHFVAIGVTKSYAMEEEEGLAMAAMEESEDAARARAGRVKAQQKKKATKKWDHGARRLVVTETSSEQAAGGPRAGPRVSSASSASGMKGGPQPKPFSPGEVPEALQPKQRAAPKKGPRYFKKDLCVDFENGFCARNTSCGFAHGVEEQEAARELFEIQKRGLPGRFKRDLCYYFETLGYCNKGAECTFAHGTNEIDAVSKVAPSDDGVFVHQGPSWEMGPEPGSIAPEDGAMSQKGKSTHKIPHLVGAVKAGAVNPSRKMI